MMIICLALVNNDSDSLSESGWVNNCNRKSVSLPSVVGECVVVLCNGHHSLCFVGPMLDVPDVCSVCMVLLSVYSVVSW
jgi:hypothetical protein